jgi:hypothetical protein
MCRDGVALTDGSRVTGSTTSTLTITNLDASDAGEYSLGAVSSCGSSSSTIVSIGIGPCPSDWDASGGVDGDDVIAFFVDWDAGSADIDESGGTDGDDVIAFFTFWDAGC